MKPINREICNVELGKPHGPEVVAAMDGVLRVNLPDDVTGVLLQAVRRDRRYRSGKAVWKRDSMITDDSRRYVFINRQHYPPTWL